MGRVGLLHQGSVSGPQSQVGPGLQQCWPGARGCPVVCGACSSALEPYAAERSSFGIHGKVSNSMEKSLVAHESVHVYLYKTKYVHVHTFAVEHEINHFPHPITHWAGWPLSSVVFFLSPLMVYFCSCLTVSCSCLTSPDFSSTLAWAGVVGSGSWGV